MTHPLRYPVFDRAGHWIGDATPPPMDHRNGGHSESQYSHAMARIILARLDAGATVQSIVSDPRFPSRRTLYDWVRDIDAFAEAWREMRSEQAAARRCRIDQRERDRAEFEAARERLLGARPRAKVGRKSTYTRAAARAWCALIAQGYTLREVATVPGMPAVAMVYRWLRNHPEFRAMYVRAARARDFVLNDRAADAALIYGWAGRGQADAFTARAAAVRPDVWRWD